jgi:hypothetical protein
MGKQIIFCLCKKPYRAAHNQWLLLFKARFCGMHLTKSGARLAEPTGHRRTTTATSAAGRCDCCVLGPAQRRIPAPLVAGEMLWPCGRHQTWAWKYGMESILPSWIQIFPWIQSKRKDFSLNFLFLYFLFNFQKYMWHLNFCKTIPLRHRGISACNRPVIRR